MAQWAFITNHAAVLRYISQNPRATTRELSLALGVTERTVINIINDLARERYLTKNKEGRRVRYSIDASLPLRHDAVSNVKVGTLLETLNMGRDKTPSKTTLAR